MTIKEICSKIAESENKKVSVSIGNIREIVGILSDLVAANPSIAGALYKNGLKRYKKTHKCGKI